MTATGDFDTTPRGGRELIKQQAKRIDELTDALEASPCKRSILQLDTECWRPPFDNCLGCDCWRSALSQGEHDNG